jgi:hypothetical protein
MRPFPSAIPSGFGRNAARASSAASTAPQSTEDAGSSSQIGFVPQNEPAAVLPMHGSGKEIGKGLENRIKKDLGLK